MRRLLPLISFALAGCDPGVAFSPGAGDWGAHPVPDFAGQPRDGTTAFVSHFDVLRFTDALKGGGADDPQGFSTLAVVDTATMARPPLYPVCPTMHGMALSADEKTLYVTCGYTDQLALFDVA